MRPAKDRLDVGLMTDDRPVASRVVSEPRSSSFDDESVEVHAGPLIPKTSVVAATWALFFGLALVMIGHGLSSSLVGLRAEQEGFGLAVSGLVMACFFFGFLAGTKYAEGAMRRVGHIRVFAALAAAASSVVLVQALLVHPLVWAGTRFVFGACMAGIYVVVESWLNDLATNATRGRILSVYMIVSMAGIGVGQLLLNIDDDTGLRLFIVASALVSLSLVPVTLSATSAPPIVVAEPVGFATLWRVVPVGVVSSFLTGTATGSFLGMGAVYASAVDMSAGRISAFLFAPMLGAVVLQWPVGWVSDRVPRRGVMFGVATVGALSALLALAVADGSVVAIAAMFMVGGALFPLYSLAVAHTNDALRSEQILGASATLVRVNGSGAVVGPVLTASLMAVFEPRLFFWVVSCIFAVVGSYLLYGIAGKDAVPLDRQRSYVPFPARASSVAALLIPRRHGTTTVPERAASDRHRSR